MAAIVGALVIHHVATVVARDAFPIAERHIGAVGVVGGQDASNQAIEVRQSSFFQRRSNGRRAVALAERLIADVRVCDGLILGCGMGIDGNDVVGIPLIQLRELVEVEGNTEPPQVYVFKGDRLGHNTQSPLLAIERDIIELFLQGPQLIDNG